jgi:hypothetical protein
MNKEQIFVLIFIILIMSMLYEFFLSGNECYAKSHGKYLKACHSGLIRGTVTAILLSNFGYVYAIQQGVVLGVLNATMIHLGY